MWRLRQLSKNGQKSPYPVPKAKMENVYNGKLEWEITEQDFSQLPMPETDPMFILADPERAFELSYYPNKGVGLMRMEFAISNSIRFIHWLCVSPEKITDADVAEIHNLTKAT
jgi:pyruvate,water dikinase